MYICWRSGCEQTDNWYCGLIFLYLFPNSTLSMLFKKISEISLEFWHWMFLLCDSATGVCFCISCLFSKNLFSICCRGVLKDIKERRLNIILYQPSQVHLLNTLFSHFPRIITSEDFFKYLFCTYHLPSFHCKNFKIIYIFFVLKNVVLPFSIGSLASKENYLNYFLATYYKSSINTN